MNSDTVEPHEILYRGIITNPNMWKPAMERPSSAAFKQSGTSLSVDRDGGREVEDIEKNLISNVSMPLKAVASFPAKKCFEKEMQVRPDPNPEGQQNPYHALVDDSKDTVGISKRNARHLALICSCRLLQ